MLLTMPLLLRLSTRFFIATSVKAVSFAMLLNEALPSCNRLFRIIKSVLSKAACILFTQPKRY
jgi:hypothetical protein